MIDTESLLVDLRRFDEISDPVLLGISAIGLIRKSADAILQLQERIETERRKLANSEDLIEMLLRND